MAGYSIKMSLQLIALALVFVCAISPCSPVVPTSHICGTQTVCSDCLYAHDDCAWCSQWDANIKPKCNTVENLLSAGCAKEFIEEGQHSFIEVVQNDELRDYNSEDVGDAVQIKPQHVKLKLRQHDVHKLKIQLRPSKNYPLDLYLLLDSSYSMADDVGTIVKLSQPLMKALQELTTSYRLGFGVFSDKPTMPWTQTDPIHMANPCVTNGQFCQPPFNFKHTLRLTNKTADFFDKVSKTKITANLDNVDGGLDALMQIMICSHEIGWLNDSRKMVIMATDSLLHFAGDGKLGGIVKPNDAKCHLDTNGMYSESLHLDYPSISQVYAALTKHKINVIFAVTEALLPVYDRLQELIPQFTYTSKLEEDSSNLLSLVRQGYENIVSKLHVQDNATDPIRIAYASNCGKHGHFGKVSSCSDVQIGKVYEFDVNIQFSDCPKDRAQRKQTIVIEEAYLGSEAVVIEMEMICGCECDSNENVDRNSIEECSNHGDIVCGLCVCERPWLGHNCECNSADAATSFDLQDQCRQNGTNFKCSGRGDCVCGVCICDSDYSGKYCQCDRCDIINFQQCGGQGFCDCGVCVCRPPYGGRNCECNTDKSTCYAPGDDVVCSGRGVCDCGKCRCNRDTDEQAYEGRHCEMQLLEVCGQFEDCVQCSLHDNCQGHECVASNRSHLVLYVQSLASENICTFRNEIDNVTCDYKFLYTFTENSIVKLEVLPQSCAFSYQEAMVVVYVLAGIFIGYILLLAIIKSGTMYKDKIEYNKFVQQQASETLNLNPLYKSPVTNFVVPKKRD